jgi:PAS domain S-box-containing protein
MPARFTSQVNRLRAALRRAGSPEELLDILRSEIERLGAAALAADNATNYVASNAAANELTGYSGAELLTMGVRDLTPFPLEKDGVTLWQEFVAKGTQHGAYELRRKNRPAVQVRYWAFASVAPGIHLSLLVPDGGTQP